MNGADDRHLVLTGFMGAGKSTLAALAAAHLGRDAYDSDEVIVTREGRSIVDIFRTSGEPLFRRLEVEVIAELLDLPPAVIALGGGALDNDETLERVKARALLANLEVSWTEIEAELPKLKETRPLLRDRSVAEIRALYQRRQAIYAQAELHIPVDRRDPQVTAANLYRALERLGPSGRAQLRGMNSGTSRSS